jgi:hypothetical protein
VVRDRIDESSPKVGGTFPWVVQALLAVAFLFAGGMKFFGIEKVLKDSAPGPGKLSLTRPMFYFIGVSELAAV